MSKKPDFPSPIDMSREIVETLTENEFIRKRLHTCICHELTADQVKEFYIELKTNFANGNQLSLNI